MAPGTGMMELVQPIKEYAARLVAEAEETTGEAHMAFNSVVNIRTTDERLLGALKRHHAERQNGEGTQVAFILHGHLRVRRCVSILYVPCLVLVSDRVQA